MWLYVKMHNNTPPLLQAMCWCRVSGGMTACCTSSRISSFKSRCQTWNKTSLIWLTGCIKQTGCTHKGSDPWSWSDQANTGRTQSAVAVFYEAPALLASERRLIRVHDWKHNNRRLTGCCLGHRPPTARPPSQSESLQSMRAVPSTPGRSTQPLYLLLLLLLLISITLTRQPTPGRRLGSARPVMSCGHHASAITTHSTRRPATDHAHAAKPDCTNEWLCYIEGNQSQPTRATGVRNNSQASLTPPHSPTSISTKWSPGVITRSRSRHTPSIRLTQLSRLQHAVDCNTPQT